jgi:hypothetical protein
MAGDESYREFLFNYRFGGEEWGFVVKATSAAEARSRLSAMTMARYEGEVRETIPARPGAGLYVRVLTWWRNKFGARP